MKRDSPEMIWRNLLITPKFLNVLITDTGSVGEMIMPMRTASMRLRPRNIFRKMVVANIVNKVPANAYVMMHFESSITPSTSSWRVSWKMIGGKRIDTKISELMLGKGNDEKIGDMTPAKMKVKVDGSPKRLVIRLVIVTKSRMLYAATMGPLIDK